MNLSDSGVQHALRQRKFRPPTRLAYQIDRPELVNQILELHASTPLTIIQAPAGYGKSTILLQTANELAARNHTVAWINCDVVDGEPENFISSLQQSLIFSSDTFQGCLNSLGSIIDTVNIQNTPTTIVLDDYEKLSASKAGDIVELLTSVLPQGNKLLIATRSLDEPKFAKMILDGVAKTVNASALTFKPTETAMLLKPYCNSESIEQLVSVAEGWPVVIQLARIKAEQEIDGHELLHSILCPHSEVFGFLVQEVLSGLSAKHIDLLTKCAIVDFIEPEIAFLLTGNIKAHSILIDIVRLQPLISVESATPLTLRLHPVLREFLLLSLAEQGTLVITALHSLAAKFYAKNNQVYKAIEHALAAGQPILACDILEENGGPLMILDYGPASTWACLKEIPCSLIDSRPALSLMRQMKSLIDGNRLGAQQSTTITHIRDDTPENHTPFSIDEIESFSKYINCLISDCWEPVHEFLTEQTNVVEKMIRDHAVNDARMLALYLPFRFFFEYRYGNIQQTQKIVSEYETICDLNQYAPKLPSISPQMGMIAFAMGNFETAAHFFSMNLTHHWDRFVGHEKPLILIGNGLLAKILYEQDRIEDSIANVKAIGTITEATFKEIFEATDITLSYCLLIRNGIDEAMQHLDRVIKGQELYGLKNLIKPLFATKVSMLLITGDISQARAVFEDQNLLSKWQQTKDLEYWDWYFVEAFLRAYAYLLITTNQAKAALQVAQEIRQKSKATNRPLITALCDIYMAIAYADLSQEELGISHLTYALHVHAKCEAVRPYIDVGAKIIPLLQTTLQNSTNKNINNHISRILDASTHYLSSSTFQNILTSRESDVLVELTKGFPTKIIARNLDVAPETVKYHLKSIFKKLEVENRKDAVSEAYRRAFIA